MPLPDFDFSLFLVHLGKILAAFVLALPIAWERERETRIMGLRTFPLVAVSSCGFVLIAISTLGLATESQARILMGLMTGIGFIGGGAIVKEEDGVHGTATAAAIWSTGLVGAAVAYNRFEIAVLVSLVTFIVLYFMTPLKHNL